LRAIAIITILFKLTAQYFFLTLQPPVGQNPLSIEVLLSHSDAPHLVGLCRTSDRTDAETSTCIAHNYRKTQTSMPPAGFEPAIPASERPHTHAFDREATGIGICTIIALYNFIILFCVLAHVTANSSRRKEDNKKELSK
jgi:hypothetical protein